MALFKCKMCGGDLEIAEGVTIAECEYCGTKQTVPKAMDENLQNLFNRANTLRMKSEFDKAEKLYEKIIQADSTQSEAYWGLILCKYGIEYVDDPKTYKKIPTCHRASYDSIIADDDYKAAIEYADMSQRILYEEQAKEIDRIQKDILALAQKEETYDVFICYKETDADGKRTQDSVIANDIYHQLTQEGFKVFYAAITLEGKLGSAYEPIIFAALNSAKVMLAIGTKPEYFNAVWVKNEWSRFLKIIKADRSKLLIPCYRDMDAYELPEEFAHLQAQDMGKIGFINDIVRGIKKVIKKDEPKPTTVVKETFVANTSTNIAPLIKRIFMFLEDSKWSEANEYCEKVLDMDPECVDAYLGKLLAELKVSRKKDLEIHPKPFDHLDNYSKIMRFGDNALIEELKQYNDTIRNRNEENRKAGIYSEAINLAKHRTPESQNEAAQEFDRIPGYRDADAKAEECRQNALLFAYELAKKAAERAHTSQQYQQAAQMFLAIAHYPLAKEQADACIAKSQELAEVERKDAIYTEATARMGSDNIAENEKAISMFESIKEWRDAEAKIVECQSHIDELKKLAEIARLEKEARAKRNKKTVIITLSTIFAVIFVIIAMSVFSMINTNIIIPNREYDAALSLMQSGKYEQAITAFENLDGYKDSNEQIKNCETSIKVRDYQKADQAYSNKEYEKAYSLFMELSGYKDSSDRAKKSALQAGKAALDQKNYDTAIEWYLKVGANDEVANAKYQYVLAHKTRHNYTTFTYLSELKKKNYKDSSSIYSELYAWKVERIVANNDPYSTIKMTSISKYDPVYIHFKLVGGYPGEIIKPYVKYTLPSGETGTYKWDYECTSNDILWYAWAEGLYNNPEYGEEGTLTVTLYPDDLRDDEPMGTITVNIGP